MTNKTHRFPKKDTAYEVPNLKNSLQKKRSCTNEQPRGTESSAAITRHISCNLKSFCCVITVDPSSYSQKMIHTFFAACKLVSWEN